MAEGALHRSSWAVHARAEHVEGGGYLNGATERYSNGAKG